MACDNICGFAKNGWHDTACPESNDSKKAFSDSLKCTCADLGWYGEGHAEQCRVTIDYSAESTIKTLHAALLEIAEIEVNANSEPETMGMTLNKIRLIARTALQEGN